MPIQAGDIKLLKSQVMDDVPEGGGAPTAVAVEDASSNSLFPDISELDRAGGRVNLRKVFASVETNDTEGFFGVNLIVAEPPKDPRVSVTLFTTDDVFDTRVSASSRMESYLARGPVYPGFLFGDHLAGQMNVTLLQRAEVPVPVVGDTLVLRKNEGLGSQFDQYVRITDVAATERSFTDSNSSSMGDFKRLQVVLGISDRLAQDFNGFDALRFDSAVSYAGKTKLSSTIVADAARYYGVSELEGPASLGDFTLKAKSIYSQLVPSTRVETPIADARMNQQLAAGVAAGEAVTRQVTLAFTTAQALYIGAGATPGSIAVARSGVSVVDKGGRLQSAGVDVGTVDYDNGVLTLATNVFGTAAGTFDLTYTPAAAPVLVNESVGLPVTVQGQRLSWIVTLDPAPVRSTLQVSFKAQGRWYVLTEDGSGAIRGSDSSFGAGTLNYGTGTVTLTLGAMPDVDSRVILTYASATTTKPLGSLPAAPGNDRGVLGYGAILPGGVGIKPGTLTLSWNDGTARTATDAAGGLTGAATGAVYYAEGRFVFRPNALPPKNTVVTVTGTSATPHTIDIPAMTDEGANWGFTLPGPIAPNALKIGAKLTIPMRRYPGLDGDLTADVVVVDNGSGGLLLAGVSVGTVDYTTGVCHLVKSTANYLSQQPVFVGWSPEAGESVFGIRQTGIENRAVTGQFGPAITTNMVSVAAGDINFTFTIDHLTADVVTTAELTAAGWQSFLRSFQVGAVPYVNRAGILQRDPSPTTGQGTAAGTVVGSTIELTDWPVGAVPTLSQVNGAIGAPLTGDSSSTSVGTRQVVGAATLRTAISPLVTGGFGVAGKWDDGAAVTATADNAGRIMSGSAAVGETPGTYGVFAAVDFESGIVDLRFGRRVPESMATAAGVVDASSLGLPGVTLLQLRGVQADTLRYSAVGYSYLPLDPAILGLNPVRLPADGRVPIFRAGSFAVVGHTGKVPAATYAAGQTINCARVRLSRVRLVDTNGHVISGGYTADLDLGLVHVDDVTGWAQPVEVEHRIEDMLMVRDAQINGQLSFTAQLTHDYPAGAYVASAMVAGDVRARTSVVFDQRTWSNEWADEVIGEPLTTAQFNHAQNPIAVTNRGALTERWACIFTGSTAFNLIGEHVGLIATGNTGNDCAPLNPATGVPYVTIPAAGWGLGWGNGNVLRFNTVGTKVPAWLARTILQGPETVPNDQFTLLIRGDVDRP